MPSLGVSLHVAQHGALDTNVCYCKMSVYQQIKMIIKENPCDSEVCCHSELLALTVILASLRLSAFQVECLLSSPASIHTACSTFSNWKIIHVTSELKVWRKLLPSDQHSSDRSNNWGSCRKGVMPTSKLSSPQSVIRQ